MKKISLFVVLFVFCMSAEASYTCHEKVEHVLVYGQGPVNILRPSRGNYTYICDLKTTWKGVSPKTCGVWVSMLLNLKNKGEKAFFYYPGNEGCAATAVYGGAPAPTYIAEHPVPLGE